MRAFLGKHKHKIIAGHGIIVVAVLMSTGFLYSNSTSTVIYFSPHKVEKLALGETTTVDVNISTNVRIDATGATIHFPEDSIDIVGFSKEKSFFDLWTEETTIKEGLGEIIFSGGTTASEGLIGTGTIMTLTIRTKKSGEAVLSFENVRIFPHDGTGRELAHESRSLTYVVASRRTPPSEPKYTPPSNPSVAQSPNPDFNGDGFVTLGDLSTLLVGMTLSYNTRYDLNVDGNIGLSDISILLSKM